VADSFDEPPLQNPSLLLLEMQPAPLRLSQTLWCAFRAAKPSRLQPRPFSTVFRPSSPQQQQPWPQRFRAAGPAFPGQARFYSDKSDVDRKAEEAKSRIDDSLDARADTAAQTQPRLKDARDETIVHTIPESSSIVHGKDKTEPHGRESSTGSKPPPPPSDDDKTLPSDFSSRYSHLRRRFTHFMDNFQTHVFTASRRLNDLTGYSGIEALKEEIERQEAVVQASRRAVKDARARYADAIAMRSQTQREVNDLLHRKHTWSPADLERFTSLYRSDHANEQTETAAQKEVQDAEARYEEASSKLAKSILARYHEEQIWSDKIRQMSTWGTWGLMGLNVLLFFLFQIAIEPWRRARLVQGFEEKVELALAREDKTVTFVQPSPPAAAAAAVAASPPMTAADRVDAVADKVAEQIVDAVSGATDAAADEAPPIPEPVLEDKLEQIAAEEIVAEKGGQPPEEASNFPSSPANSRWTSPSSPLAWYEDLIRARLSDSQHITLTRRELTTVAMEGVAGGMALMGLLLVLLRPR
jgi:sensitive to high expression protein 9